MGFSVEKFEATEKGKKYVVYKYKAVYTYLILFLISVATIISIAPSISGKSLSNSLFLTDIIIWLLCILLVVLRGIETREGSFAEYRNKQIIKKGSTALSFSRPLERWIEK